MGGRKREVKGVGYIVIDVKRLITKKSLWYE